MPSKLSRRPRTAPAGLAALLLVSGLLAAGCSSSKGKTAAKPADSPSTSAAAQTLPASDEFGKRAKIDIPATGNPSGKLDVTVKIPGHGPKIANGDLLVLNFTGKLWRGAKDLGSSYDKGQGPVEVVEGQQGQMLQGWQDALLGQQAGSRIEVVVPPDKGFGAQGTKDGQLQITGTDTLVFDIDVYDVYSAGKPVDIPAGTLTQADATLPQVTGAPDGTTPPKITIPAGKQPPAQGVYKTLIQGTGRTVTANDTMVVQYEGALWKDGKTFDTSFGKKPFATGIGQGLVVPGWDEGLVGQKVGSRVLLVIPPDKGYGANPPQGSGISATDTMVFVVDIIDAQPTS